VTPQALDKLWRKSKAGIPHLRPDLYPDLHALAMRLHQPEAQFWGVVDEKLRFREKNVVHCFNYGNTSIKYPWDAEAINFGQRLPLRITHGGTIRTTRNYRTLLHQVDSPYLVFGFEDATLAEERLQSGYVITEPGTGTMVTEREVVMSPAFSAPEEGGLLFYFLTKRVPFTCEPMDPFLLRGVNVELPRFRLRLPEPMLLEPGWVLLMLEKDRWMWGVVAA
jgi:hypothetical protein